MAQVQYLQHNFYKAKKNTTQKIYKKYKKYMNSVPTGPNQSHSQIIFQKKSPTQDFIKRTLVAAAGFIRSIVVIIMMTGGHDPILRLRNY